MHGVESETRDLSSLVWKVERSPGSKNLEHGIKYLQKKQS